MESLLFIVLSTVGAGFLSLALIIFTVALVKKSSKLKKVAFISGTIGIVNFGLVLYYYMIAVPSTNQEEMNDYTGVYIVERIRNEIESGKYPNKDYPKLILFNNGTFEYDNVRGLHLRKHGIWKTGDIDGKFGFYDRNGSLINFAYPSSNKLVFNDSILFIRHLHN